MKVKERFRGVGGGYGEIRSSYSEGVKPLTHLNIFSPNLANLQSYLAKDSLVWIAMAEPNTVCRTFLETDGKHALFDENVQDFHTLNKNQLEKNCRATNSH